MSVIAVAAGKAGARGSSAVRRHALRLTKVAGKRIRKLLDHGQKEHPRLGVKVRSCSGLTYSLKYADDRGKFDKITEDKGVKVLIDPRALVYVVGIKMDSVEGQLKYLCGFVFINPNSKGQCGCGESFTTFSNIFARPYCSKALERG